MLHITGLSCSNDSDTVITAMKQVLCIIQSGTGEPYGQFLDAAVFQYLSGWSEHYLVWYAIEDMAYYLGGGYR